jgi:hypothetical protein
MSAFVLGPAEEDELRRAVAAAKARPLTLPMLRACAGAAAPAQEDGVTVVTGERPEDMPRPQEVVLPLGWRVNISCEEQPGGTCLHVSMSSPTPAATLPSREAVAMVLEAIGYPEGAEVAISFWLEDFREAGELAGRAVNLLLPIRKVQ